MSCVVEDIKGRGKHCSSLRLCAIDAFLVQMALPLHAIAQRLRLGLGKTQMAPSWPIWFLPCCVGQRLLLFLVLIRLGSFLHPCLAQLFQAPGATNVPCPELGKLSVPSGLTSGKASRNGAEAVSHWQCRRSGSCVLVQCTVSMGTQSWLLTCIMRPALSTKPATLLPCRT